MPRIDDKWLDSVIYLYPTLEQAYAGERAGGCGFLLGVEAEPNESERHVYAVTNSHVIREGGSPVIRVNTQDGGVNVVEKTADDWEHHPDGDDIAVCQVVLSDDRYKTNLIPKQACVNNAHIHVFGMGPGDDVFALSRFVEHEGRQRNTPVVRFGNVAMMPIERIKLEGRDYSVDAFLVEARSLSGHSGSPVFVYLNPDGFFNPGDRALIPNQMIRGPWLLGVDFAHMPWTGKVKDNAGGHPEGWTVELNSGFMAVAPAWKLQEWLDSPEMVAGRLTADGA